MPRETLSDYLDSEPVAVTRGRKLIVTARRSGRLQWRWDRQRRMIRGEGIIRLRPTSVTVMRKSQPVQRLPVPRLAPPFVANLIAATIAIVVGLIWHYQAEHTHHG